MLILSWESGNELDVHYVNVDGKFYMFQYQYHVLPASSLTSIQPLFFFIPSLLSLLFYQGRRKGKWGDGRPPLECHCPPPKGDSKDLKWTKIEREI